MGASLSVPRAVGALNLRNNDFRPHHPDVMGQRFAAGRASAIASPVAGVMVPIAQCCVPPLCTRNVDARWFRTLGWI